MRVKRTSVRGNLTVQPRQNVVLHLLAQILTLFGFNCRYEGKGTRGSAKGIDLNGPRDQLAPKHRSTMSVYIRNYVGKHRTRPQVSLMR
jgi:hypothetical protein